ncbi:hypothetical protein, partial [Paraburkholderia ultramafica]|uniref:hypothetical protein n=1 Tax=Paraburkholderia ultramafica TaxID=1544867 RepID=UPI001C2F04F7
LRVHENRAHLISRVHAIRVPVAAPTFPEKQKAAVKAQFLSLSDNILNVISQRIRWYSIRIPEIDPVRRMDLQLNLMRCGTSR